MAVELVFVVVVLGLAAGFATLFNMENQLKQLRRELDETQRQVNELKAATDVVPPPPLPRPGKQRSGRLDDLRAQLRASHGEAQQSSEE